MNLSDDWDRAVAEERFEGNTALADHLDNLRPLMRFDDSDGKFAALAAACSNGLVAASDALGGDPFDMMTILLLLIEHVTDSAAERGLNKTAAMRAVISSLQAIWP
jgi:hypothetical protein